MKKITLFCFALITYCLQTNAQSTINITTSGGNYATEKWVNITTEANGAGTQVWGQGDGNYGNGQGLINEDISIAPGTYYVNCYDRYSDGWDGTLISVTAYGSVLGDNGGASPNDPNTNDTGSTWETPADELEASFEIVVPNPPSCAPPISLVSTPTALDQATITWAAGGTEDNWTYEYGVSPYAQGGGGTSGTVMTTPSLDLTGLLAGETYDIYIQANCGGEDSTYASLTWTQPTLGGTCGFAIMATVESDCSTATPYTIDYGSAADLGTTDLSCDTFGVNTGAWFSFVAPTSGAVNVSFTDTNEYALFDACGGTEVECNGTASNLAELTGLTPSNTYYLAVWKDSATTGSTDVCFEEVSCGNPSAMTESNITANTVDLSWTLGGSESDWNLEWAAGADFTPGNMEEDDATSVTGTAAHQLTGLTGNTTYYVYYQANCGSETSDWAGPFTFTTACDAFTPDYTEAFDTFAPDCWSEATGPITGPTSFGTAGWIADGFGNNGSSGSARFNIFGTGGNDWLLSPTFDLTGGGFEINLDVALTTFSGTNSGTIESDDAVYVMQSLDGGTTWTTIYTWDNSNVPSNTGDNLTIDISAETSATAQFAIFALEGDTSGGDYNIYIDNFKVRTPLVCTSAVVDSATIADDCGNAQFYVAVDVTTLGDATQINDGTSTYAISGVGVLQVGPFASGSTVTLDVEHSDVACNFSLGDFTYVCPPVNDDVCNAIALTVGATSAGDAYTSTGATAQTGEVEGSCFNGGIDTSVWFTFVAPAGGNVTVTTDITGGTFTDTEVAVYEAPSDCSDASTLVTQVGCDQDGGTDVNYNSVVDLTGLVEGETYYVQVDRWGGTAGGTFGIEVVDNTLSTDSFELNGFEYYPNPVNDKLSLRAQNNIQNVSIYNMLGQEVMRTLPNVTDTEVDMSELQNGAYFVKVTINNSIKTIKILKK